MLHRTTIDTGEELAYSGLVPWLYCGALIGLSRFSRAFWGSVRGTQPRQRSAYRTYGGLFCMIPAATDRASISGWSLLKRLEILGDLPHWCRQAASYGLDCVRDDAHMNRTRRTPASNGVDCLHSLAQGERVGSNSFHRRSCLTRGTGLPSRRTCRSDRLPASARASGVRSSIVDSLLPGRSKYDVAALASDRDGICDCLTPPPVTLTTTFTPSPPVMSMTLETRSSFSMSIVWVAPSMPATSRRMASRVSPLTMMQDAPAALAAITHARPCWPGPCTRIASPRPTSPYSYAHSMPLEKGRKAAAGPVV